MILIAFLALTVLFFALSNRASKKKPTYGTSNEYGFAFAGWMFVMLTFIVAFLGSAAASASGETNRTLGMETQTLSEIGSGKGNLVIVDSSRPGEEISFIADGRPVIVSDSDVTIFDSEEREVDIYDRQYYPWILVPWPVSGGLEYTIFTPKDSIDYLTSVK